MVTVAALIDSGSESLYFHPDLERLGVTRKPKKFTLETLSMEGRTEHVEGLLVGFNILMSSGDLKQIELLRHDGIARSGTQFCGKVLTVPRQFAEK